MLKSKRIFQNAEKKSQHWSITKNIFINPKLF